MKKDTIVVEISGKSSIVALLDMLDIAKENNKTYRFIFHIAYIPAEYDSHPTRNIFSFGEILKMHVQRFGHEVFEMLFSSETNIWFDLVKKSMKNTYSNPCLYCLAYSHLTRLDVALMHGRASNKGCAILTGERLNSKANQNNRTIELFDKYFSNYGIEFIRPVLNKDSEYIEKRFEEFCDIYGIGYDLYPLPKCKFSDMNHVDNIITDDYFNNIFDIMDDILEEYRASLLEIGSKCDMTEEDN